MDGKVLLVSLSLFTFGCFGDNISSLTEPFEVRLVQGPSRCEGELQMKRNDTDWLWVSAPYWGLRLAHMVCVALDCGSALHTRAVEADRDGDRWDINPDCEETRLDNCVWPGFNMWFPIVELKCSESVRLLPGVSLCSGPVQIHQNQSWTWLCDGDLDQQGAAVVCRELGCGAPSLLQGALSPQTFHCEGHESALKDCPRSRPETNCSSATAVHLSCSESVRLLPGVSLCSGPVQIHQNQSWTWLCDGDLDQQGAAVVCRELGCGAPSLLQGALSHQTFHCEGHESALKDCPRSRPETNCFSVTAVHLSCSAPPADLRLVGHSRCAGSLELRHQDQWRLVKLYQDVTLDMWEGVCEELLCGSRVSMNMTEFPRRPAWEVSPGCALQSPNLSRCVEMFRDTNTSYELHLVCSDLLSRPNISVSGVSGGQVQGRSSSQTARVQLGADFSVRCSAEAQFPGGFFQLLAPAQNYTVPAVDHSTHFLFQDAGPAHTGNYTCVYHLHMFNYNFSSRSPALQLSLGVSASDLIVRLLVIVLLNILYICALCCFCQARQQKRNTLGKWEIHTIHHQV
ncbi:hypothetical protein WMY93_028133 [Mugilogobius chulae]|uniref:SRCR domain-containing protein n=1 Tax=Mugilogobius chulae TaxID=88201 RepID=A0AAW0MW66_9GOBI